jgi:hypothetical protein
MREVDVSESKFTGRVRADEESERWRGAELREAVRSVRHSDGTC